MPVQSPSVSVLLYLHLIEEPWETEIDDNIPGDDPDEITKSLLVLACACGWTLQVDPPSVEYSAVTYAVDPEVFWRESVDVA